MVIIENEQEFEELCKIITSPVYAIPFMIDFNDHPCVNEVCLVSFIVNDEHYIIPFQHNETINLSYKLIQKISTISPMIITPDKKLWGHLFGLNELDVVDMNGLEYLTTGTLAEETTFYTSTMKKMYSMFRKQKNINKAIPLMDLIKYFDAVHAHMTKVYMDYFILDGVNRQISIATKFHNDVIIPSLEFIERSGLCVNPEFFKKHYPGKEHNIIECGKGTNIYEVFTDYNPYSITGRITNAFDGINYAALSTKDGTRNTFISRFGKQGTLLSLDYTSFHPLIVASLVGYTFPEPVYQFLAKQYFNVADPSAEEIQASKIHTMKLMYDENQSSSPIEFIQKMYDYRNTLWNTIKKNGHIYSPTGRKIKLSSIYDPTPGKVLSYIIQCREMEITMTAISELLPLYKNIESKVILYTYDSVLFDIKDSEKDIILKTIEIMEQQGKFPVHGYCGETYGNMKILKKNLATVSI